LGELAGLGILGHCVRAILQAKLKESLKHIETYWTWMPKMPQAPSAKDSQCCHWSDAWQS
jgi:hypothetical protein